MTKDARRCMAVLALLAIFTAQAQPQTPAQARIALHGPGPFHKLELPLAIHGRAAFDDLRDLRVRNASGDVVPWAWLDDLRATGVETTTRVRASLFALPPAMSDREGSGVRIASRPDGVLALETAGSGSTAPTQAPSRGRADDWVIDTGQMDGKRIRVRFELAPGSGSNGLFPFTLQASDDLHRWRSIDADGQIARLRHGPAVIEQASVELGSIEGRFLRLRWRHPAQAPRLSAAWVDVAEQAATPSTWTADVGPSSCGIDACDYPVPRGLPLQGLRISLNQPNTLASLSVLAIDRSAEAPPSDAARPHRLRHAHRHESRLPGVEESLLAEATVFRLDLPSGETRSSAISLDGRSHTMLRLRTRGAIAALGAVPPTLSYSARPSTLVFLAQGRPPFTLSWNRDRKTALPMPEALPLRQLIPGSLEERLPGIDSAIVTFEKPVDATSTVVSAATASMGLASAAVASSAGQAAIRSTGALPRAYLWGALATGMLLLLAMAWSLLRASRSIPAAQEPSP